MPHSALYLVSLGCPKNRVDSEAMLGIARQAGLELASSPSDADVIVVNTCGFIGPAKKESIDTILEMAEHRREGRCRSLVVTGCLAQAHAAELAAELPEVDHVLGVGDVERLAEVLGGGAERVLVGEPQGFLPTAAMPRVLSTSAPLASGIGAACGPTSAYVKIAEGCDRTCSFCIIPKLRGRHRSRAPADVVQEVEQLCAQGVKEINLISQDTTAYGRDRKGGRDAPGAKLAELTAQVADVAGVRWVRLLYLYPDALADSLLELIASHPKVVPYVDVPLQHATDHMLRLMGRGHGAQRVRDLVARLRSTIDDVTIRTAFIVGHPGETQRDFDTLCEFLSFGDFDRVGVFRYSDEEGTRSHGQPDKISPLVAANRARKLEAMARRIARTKTAALVGQRLDVLVEGPSDEHEAVLTGRHAGQAPEIDGQIYLSTAEAPDGVAATGAIVPARITQASEVDLVGVPEPR